MEKQEQETKTSEDSPLPCLDEENSSPEFAGGSSGFSARAMRFLSGPGGVLCFGILCFAILAAFSGHRFLHQSKAPHFIWQAQAFLHGSLSLIDDPPNLEDWVRLNGRWFVSFPAFPALAMVPFVFLFGYAFNDTSFTVAAAALGLIFFHLLLRRLRMESGGGTGGEGTPASTDQKRLLSSFASDGQRNLPACYFWTFILGFGTLFFSCAIRGEVWFTAEIMGVGLTSAYLLAGMGGRHPVLAGLFYSMATLTRTPLVFSAIFFFAEVILSDSGRLDRERIRRDLKPILRKILLFVLGALPLALLHMAFNAARFGSIAEFGHALFWNNRVNADIAQWGLFHPHYLARNLHAAFLALPKVSLSPLKLGYDPHGLSMFITTPLFILLLVPRRDWSFHSKIPLILAAAAIALPGLFYQNDGFMQFGFRFSLDYTPFLILLLAMKAKTFPKPLVITLAVLGICVNTWGAAIFRGYSW